MNYTNEKEQIVFLRDADIARSIDGKTIAGDIILSNGVPAYDLFKERYDELSTYDNNICAYIRNSIEVSVDNLSTEIKTLRAETVKLSDDICLSVVGLSGIVEKKISADLYQLSTDAKKISGDIVTEIENIKKDVKGGVNYKGHLKGFEDLRNLPLCMIFGYHYNLVDTEGTHALSASIPLNNGWLYNVSLSNGSYDVTDPKPFTLENNDYIIIHSKEKDISCVEISDLTRDNIDIIEAVQDDYVRFALLEQISNCLSTDYVNKIYNLSSSLCGIVQLSVKNLQDQVIANDADIEFLSSEAKRLSTELSDNIDVLSVDLTTLIFSTSSYISSEVQKNDTDIAFLSDELSTYEKYADLSISNLCTAVKANDNDIEFLSNNISVEVKRNLDSVHYKKDIIFDPDDNTIRATLERTFGDDLNAEIRVGYLLRFPADHTIVNEITAAYHWSYDFEENDYIIFRENTTPKIASEKSFDIIKDYDKEIERTYNSLCSQMFDVSTLISNDISYLSSITLNKISADLYQLSADAKKISGDICLSADQISAALNKLSDSISADIYALTLSVDGISTIVTTLSSNLCADITTLSASLSTDIDTKYADLTTLINTTSSFISGEVAKNDVDIANIQDYISGDNSLCTELSDVKYHYNKTFVEDSYVKGPDKKVDVLKVVNSEDTTDKFKLIYLSGTLVLETL